MARKNRFVKSLALILGLMGVSFWASSQDVQETLNAAASTDEAARGSQARIDQVVNETQADMWNGMGRALLNLNQPKDAVAAYKKARAIDPDKPDVLFGLGMAYAEIPQRKEAEETLNEFLNKAANSPEHIKKAAQDTIMRMQGP